MSSNTIHETVRLTYDLKVRSNLRLVTVLAGLCDKNGMLMEA